ncbi:MAG TPA: HEAT repeat domain-containing protein [Candidatus Acidoferrales bacterium]|nr:HEAT repeat domain-containing protein [Candidatus Acidoferrales bacterium]
MPPKIRLHASLLAVTLLLAAFPCATSADTNDEAQQIGILQSRSASPSEKDAACAWLKRHGTAQSVPALASLLTDAQLSQSARYALESMREPEAENALIAAVAQTSGLTKAGVINSLGVRHDARAVPALAKLLTDSDAEIVGASAAALGDIATPDALKALEGQLNTANPATQTAMADGCLRCAQHALKAGEDKEAMAIYQEIYQRPGKEFVHVAAWRGMVLAEGADGWSPLAQAITNGPASLQMAAVQLAHEVKVPGASEALAGLLSRSAPFVQVGLIDALSQRDDPAAAPAIAAVAKETEPEPRVAAAVALGNLGSDAHIPLLIEIAARAGDPAQASARQALTLVHRGNPNKTLVKMLPSATPDSQVEILRALNNRSAVEATPQLLAFARQAQDLARDAVFQALGHLVEQRQLGDLVQLVGQMTTEDGRVAAAQAVGAACRHIQRHSGTVDMTPVLAAFKGSSTETRIALLPVCSGSPGSDTRTILRSSLGDSDAGVHAAAVRALCNTVDADLAPDVEKIATESPDEESRTLAIEACVRLATQEESITMAPTDQVKLFQALVPAATTAAQKRLVLSGLATMPDDGALKLALPLLADVTVSNEAARAVIAICRRLPTVETVETALTNVLSSTTDDQVRQDARALAKLVASRAAYITNWEYVGPYRQAGKNYVQLFDIVFPPEVLGAPGVHWRNLPVNDDPDHAGEMDFLKTIQGEQVVAYARTSIHCPAGQPAKLFVNSDDGVKIWLNGEVVHANNTQRGLNGPPDEVKITLKPGWNDLVLKVTQNIAGWGFSVRLTDPNGDPIKGLQITAGPAHSPR